MAYYFTFAIQRQRFTHHRYKEEHVLFKNDHMGGNGVDPAIPIMSPTYLSSIDTSDNAILS